MNQLDANICALQRKAGKFRRELTLFSQDDVRKTFNLGKNTVSNFERGQNKNTELIIAYAKMLQSAESLECSQAGLDLMQSLFNLIPEIYHYHSFN